MREEEEEIVPLSSWVELSLIETIWYNNDIFPIGIEKRIVKQRM
jgi:hypothetical protein